MGWDLGGILDGELVVGPTGLGQETLCPCHQPPAALGRNGGPSPWIPHLVLWKFRFLREYEFCEIYLTVAEVRHFPSSPLHLGDFIFLVTKPFRADWPHSDIFGMSFFFFFF